MIEFLRRHALAIAILAIAGLVATALMGYKLMQVTDEQRIRNITAVDLPGPRGQLSERSKEELQALLGSQPFVLGGWAQKRHFSSRENPVFFHWGGPIVDSIVVEFDRAQRRDAGLNSSEVEAYSTSLLGNAGLIECAPIETTIIPRMIPKIEDVARTACIATIPPFADDVNIVIFVLVSAGPKTLQIDIVKRLMLQAQIDIFNRDYMGKETWAGSLNKS